MKLRLPKIDSLMKDENFTSKPTFKYNCVGYAVGKPSWFDPSDDEGMQWHDDVARDTKISSYIEFFKKHGFEECDDGKPEAGWEKIAVFGQFGMFEHVAIQTVDGYWLSKLGELEDIVHPQSSIQDMESNHYGKIVRYMRRKGKTDRVTGFPLK